MVAILRMPVRNSQESAQTGLVALLNNRGITDFTVSEFHRYVGGYLFAVSAPDTQEHFDTLQTLAGGENVFSYTPYT